ncbi:hypothetical protein [Spiroplasma culicicola]|uniref:Transmembrane protein n=1 Tax=Spiroplasma culicicola AES-1 TaxID=1276246 RepID=W6AFT7_9MOLU|nr:hypothetical protein [Spiroplasma culicicola]AHI52574.1 hypothetical protein SCULI_v1c02330 [Spiroplasma culicicola AES-1]
MTKVEQNKLKSVTKKLKKHFVINKRLLIGFSINLSFLFIVAILFIVDIVTIKNDMLNYILIAMSGYFILFFTIVGWFSTEYYYKNIRVYDVNLKVGEHVFDYKREIDNTAIGYIVTIIFASFLATIIFVYELIVSFEHSDSVFIEIGIISVHLLLIPSFVRMFETILEVLQKFKKVLNHYLTTQFDSLDVLFDDVQFAPNSTHLIFTDFNLTSKNNIFLITSKKFSQEDQEKINEFNLKILEQYKEMWADYSIVYSMYRNSCSEKNYRNIRQMKMILITFLKIWDDFFKF